MRLNYMTQDELSAHCQRLMAWELRRGAPIPAPQGGRQQFNEALSHVRTLAALDPDYAIFSARLQETLQPHILSGLFEAISAEINDQLEPGPQDLGSKRQFGL